MSRNFDSVLLGGLARFPLMFDGLMAIIGLTVILGHSLDFGLIKLALLAMAVFQIVLFCVAFLGNLLFLVRQLLLATVGYFAFAVKTIDENALFSVYEPSTQTIDIALLMFGCTAIALFASSLGLTIGVRAAGISLKRTDEQWPYRALFFVAFLAAIAAAYYQATGYGASIFAAGYTSTQAESRLLGNVNAIGNAALYIMLLSHLKKSSRLTGVLLIVGIVAFWGWGMLIRGGRQDVMSGVFGLFIVYNMMQGKSAGISPRVFFAIFGIVLIFETIGIMRADFFSQGFGVFASSADFQGDMIAQGIYHFGTLSPIATTFANSLALIDSNTIDHSLGRGYLDYISRTLPEFIYPERPDDYALLFQRYGMQSGGGIFEIGEAYINFGLVGVFLVPFIISLLLARIYTLAIFHGGMIYYFLMFGFLATWLRGAWYQTFAFYKTTVTCLLMLFAVYLFKLLFVPGNRQAGAFRTHGRD